MIFWYRSIALFLSVFMFVMHPLALLATEISIIPSYFLFSGDLYKGIDSEEVRFLQIVLNNDPRTQVSPTGPGSPNNETTYFGLATENAVKRFQNIYRSIILDPQGFSTSTGIIGSKSRSVLNQILIDSRKSAPVNTTTPTTPPNSSQSSNNSGAAVAAGAIGAGIAVGALTSAATSAALPVFGGRITYVQYCTCNASVLLFIYDFDKKNILQLMYIPGYSKLYSQYNIWTPGPQVLGGYHYGSIGCLVYAGTSCVNVGTPVGTIDSIRGVGTSAF